MRQFVQGKLEMAGGCKTILVMHTCRLYSSTHTEATASLLSDNVLVDCLALPVVAQSLAVCFAIGMHTSGSSQPGHALSSLLQEFICQVRLTSLSWFCDKLGFCRGFCM